MKGGWCLSFDCATKTFAYSLSFIDLQKIRGNLAEYFRKAEIFKKISEKLSSGTPQELERFTAALAKFDAEISSCVVIEDGAVVDLLPDQKDSDIDEIPRVRALCEYVAEKIMPKLPADTTIFIEYQMSANIKARSIATALIALFYKYEVIMVNPSLKNKISFSPEGEYRVFTEKYSTLYSANKAHAKYNFQLVEKIMGSKIPPTTADLRGHIADSFMQVIGYCALRTAHGGADSPLRTAPCAQAAQTRPCETDKK